MDISVPGTQFGLQLKMSTPQTIVTSIDIDCECLGSFLRSSVEFNGQLASEGNSIMILTSAGIIYSVSGDGIVSVGNDLYEFYGPKF